MSVRLRRSALVAATAAGLLLLPPAASSPASAATNAPGARANLCPGGALAPHAPINVGSDADFKAANGVVKGTGTAANPYVISCWSIVAPAGGTGISIGTTAKAFTIRDVAVSGAVSGETGIKVMGDNRGPVTNTATITHVSATGLGTAGIWTNSTHGSVTVSWNRFDHDGDGYRDTFSHNVVVDRNDGTGSAHCINMNSVTPPLVAKVTNNTCMGATSDGFVLFGDTSAGVPPLEATGNKAQGSAANGFNIRGAVHAAANTATGNGNGFGVVGANVVEKNTSSGNTSMGMDLSAGNGSLIRDNVFQGNGSTGISINAANAQGELTTDNVIAGNHVGDSPYGIVLFAGAASNLVQGTDWTDGEANFVRFADLNTVVDAGSAQRGVAGTPTSFHDYVAAASVGPNKTFAVVTGIHWDFGDGGGLDLPLDALQGHALPPDVRHAYARPGKFTATLTVRGTDTNGAAVALADTTPVTIKAAGLSASLLPPAPGSAAWPSLGNDPARTFYNRAEQKITKASVGQLRVKWRFPTTEPVTASPAVAQVTAPPAGGGPAAPTKVVFDGDFAGTLYAIRASDGLPLWTTCLAGSLPAPVCAPAVPGRPYNPDTPTDYGVIDSSPAIATVTLPGGAHEQRVFEGANADLAAVDAATGTIRWRFHAGGHEPSYDIESSPMVVGNTVLFSIDCNQHCQQGGGVYAVDAGDGHLLWFFDPASGTAFRPAAPTFAFAPTDYAPMNAHTCGGIWSSQAVDVSLGLLYVDSANCDAPARSRFHEAIYALHIADGSPAWFYQPRALDSRDMDFGATPNAFRLGNRDVVGAGGKDGVYYLLDAAKGTLIWRTKLSLGGSLGGFFNGATDGNRIYLSSAIGETSELFTPQDDALRGREYALDARTGNLVWRQYVGSPNFGQDSLIPGVYFTGGLDHALHGWDADTGAPVWTFPVGGAVSSSPVVAGGELFVGAGTGATYRSEFVNNGDPLGLTPLQLPHPIPLYEPAQAIYGFCLATDPACLPAPGG